MFNVIVATSTRTQGIQLQSVVLRRCLELLDPVDVSPSEYPNLHLPFFKGVTKVCLAILRSFFTLRGVNGAVF